jgi:lipoprotein-anchoring transpeptidase ErfK/SrfK
MAIYYRSRRRNRTRTLFLLLSAGSFALGIWWTFLRSSAPAPAVAELALTPQPRLTTDRPDLQPSGQVDPRVSEKGDSGSPVETVTPKAPTGQKAESLVEAGKQAMERGDLITARTHLSEALRLGVKDSELPLVRAELTRIGAETILSGSILTDDPLISRYIIKPGDTLGKVAKAQKVSPELIARINGIADVNRIRAGQTIKIIHGPFDAVVHKRDHVLEVYMGSTLVKHFTVGLGADNGTPTGEWRVGTKLVNPTYYPPRGGKIVSADDPTNPLGERWIGLIGLSGEAVGQERYGIHGTIEPDSIGRSVSLGCVRMHNEDVAILYTYLVEKHSKITIRK